MEISEILVHESYYDRGCAVVEAWDAEQDDKTKNPSRYCRQCGSRNCVAIPHLKLGSICKCKDCGNEFPY